MALIFRFFSLVRMCRILLNFDIFFFAFLQSAEKKLLKNRNKITAKAKVAIHGWKSIFWQRVDKTTKYSFHFL